MDMSPQLNDILTGFNIAMSYPETKNLPLIIGESDPEGCAACGMATNPENAYRNGTLYSSYTAASFARKYLLADQTKVNFLGAVSWSFEFENQPWFYGFRDLATNGVDKPVLNVFRMFAMMKGDRVAVEGSSMYPLETILSKSVRGENPDIGGLASIDENSAAIMAWNYHDTDKPAPDTAVTLTVNNIPGKSAMMKIYVIDKDNSNSYEVWKKMGSPQNPTTSQIAELEAAGQLKCISTQKVKITNNTLTLPLQLQRQAVALVKLDW